MQASIVGFASTSQIDHPPTQPQPGPARPTDMRCLSETTRATFTAACVGAFSLLSSLAGCSSSGHHAPKPPASGTLSGHAREYGGPLVNGTPAANGVPYPDIVVTAEKSGVPVATATTGPDGDFSFTLAAGTYTITGCQSVVARVLAAKNTVQDIACPVP